MYVLKLALVCVLLGISLEISCKKDEKKMKKSLLSISKCVGKPFDLKDKLSSVEECLNNRFSSALEAKRAKNKKFDKKKKAEKFNKKVNKKCLSECEWTELGLSISEPSPKSNGSAQINFESALKQFPSEIQEILHARFNKCLNTTKVDSSKKKPCSGTKDLMKCFRKAVKKVCKADSVASLGVPPVGGTNSTEPRSDKNDDDEDDDDEDDDDEDDEDEDEESTTMQNDYSTMSGSTEYLT